MTIPSPAEGTVLIKKYSNRRLYDTSQSRYITLEDLAGIVQSGTDVKVVDASGGQDLTRQVLTQVILEQQERLDLIPVELLHAVIRSQGTIQQGPLSTFLAAATKQFVSTGNLWAQQMANLFGSVPGLSSIPGFGKPAGGAPPGSGGFEAPPPSPPPGPGAQGERGGSPESAAPREARGEDSGEDLTEMRRRMDALLSRLNKG